MQSTQLSTDPARCLREVAYFTYIVSFTLDWLVVPAPTGFDEAQFPRVFCSATLFCNAHF